MIRTDGQPTIAWAPSVTSEPQPAPPERTPESFEETKRRMELIRQGYTPARGAHDRPARAHGARSVTACPQGQQTFRVYRQGISGWKLVCAKDEERAAKRVKGATNAELVRPSSWWQEQRRLGSYPVRGSKTRRRIGK